MATVLLALITLFAVSALIDAIFGWNFVDWIDERLPRQKPLKYEGDPRPKDPSWEDEEFIKQKVLTEKFKKEDKHKKLKESFNAALREIKENTQTIELPDFIRDLYSKKMIMSRHEGGKVALYTPKQWEKRKQQIDKKTDNKGFQRFLKANGVSVEISDEDRVKIPDFLLNFLESEGEIRFTYENGIICMERNSCLCDTEYCRKCLALNCRDLLCDKHKAVDKLKHKRNIPDKSTEIKKEIKLLEKVVGQE